MHLVLNKKGHNEIAETKVHALGTQTLARTPKNRKEQKFQKKIKVIEQNCGTV